VRPFAQLVIAGKYRLLEQLGEGGMGSVWRAEHLLLCSQVAIKLISPERTASAEVLRRFLRKAQAAASLRSPHVVQILDYGVEQDTPYIAMELLDGESLRTRLYRVGRLPPASIASLFLQIGRAVARAHESGIVHRDLKPDNVFIIRNDEEEIAKVLDFGIAKLTSNDPRARAADATRTGAMLGTPFYMSPEQVEGARELDHRSDIWTIGVLAFECLLGRKPFEAKTISGLARAICSQPMPVPSRFGPVPPGFDEWFARACRRRVDSRFGSAKEATRELKRLCEASAVSVSSGTRASEAEFVAPRELHTTVTIVGLDSPSSRSTQSLPVPPARRGASLAALAHPRTIAVVGALVALAGGALAWLGARHVAPPGPAANFDLPSPHPSSVVAR
jgi:eukaryotic-like serine/threonine-protein kinase